MPAWWVLQAACLGLGLGLGLAGRTCSERPAAGTRRTTARSSLAGGWGPGPRAQPSPLALASFRSPHGPQAPKLKATLTHSFSGEGSGHRRRCCPFRVRFADETLQDTALRYWERSCAGEQAGGARGSGRCSWGLGGHRLWPGAWEQDASLRAGCLSWPLQRMSGDLQGPKRGSEVWSKCPEAGGTRPQPQCWTRNLAGPASLPLKDFLRPRVPTGRLRTLEPAPAAC